MNKVYENDKKGQCRSPSDFPIALSLTLCLDRALDGKARVCGWNAARLPGERGVHFSLLAKLMGY